MINIYKASAGSGKTFTLVREYFKLVMGVKDEETGEYRLRGKDDLKKSHRSILAITFTNKATDEMKQRIVKELFILSQTPKDSPHLDYLMTTLKAGQKEIQKAATDVLRQILNDFTNFNVSTIDSFFQTILRTFAQESDVAGNYSVEINDDYAIAVGVSDLKQSLRSNQDKQLLQWLSDFMISKVDDGKSWNIFNDNSDSKKGGGMTLSSFAANLSKEIVKKNRDALEEYLSDRTKIIKFNDELKSKIIKLKETIQDDATAILEISTKSAINYKSYFQKILEKAQKDDTDFTTSANLDSYLEKYNDDSKWFNKKDINHIPDNIKGEIQEKWEDLKRCIRELKPLKMVLSQLFFLGLLGDIDKNIRNYNIENNVILLSDTNEMLRKIINKDDTPFIYERVGVKLDHYLMDEFQDTSKMQWENIRPLIDNSLATDNDNLVIGDVKQSIYRFRNSDPKLLKDQIYSDFPYQCNEPNKGDKKSNTNWRSCTNVVKFNNTLFSFIAEDRETPEDIRKVYENVVQGIAHKDDKIQGHVKLEVFEKDDNSNFEEQALDTMLHDILDLLDRGYEQRDITILVNKNSEGVKVINQLLAYSAQEGARKLDVVSDESLLISKCPSVKIILGILSLLDNKAAIKDDNQENQTQNTKRKLPLLIKRINYNLSNQGNASEAFSKAFSDKDNDLDEDFLGGAQECAGLDAIVERIIKKFILPHNEDKDQMEELGDTAYIQAFQDYVFSYEQRFGSNLHQFLKWWNANEHKCTITSPDNINAIKVMTIHKSKGLEFPCVIIPFANWEFDKQGLEWLPGSTIAPLFKGHEEIIPPILPIKRETVKETQPGLFDEAFKAIETDSVMDSLNKTYVAFTRAISELIIYTAKKDRVKGLYEKLEAFKNLDLDSDDKTEKINPSQYVNDNVLELGEPTHKELKEKKEDTYDKAETRIMPQYKVQLSKKELGFRVPEQLKYDHDDPRYVGDALHAIMSKVNVKEDLDYAVKYFLSRGIYDNDKAGKYRRILENALENEETANWFAQGNRYIKERPVKNSQGIKKRPDRVVITPSGKVIIIDYKFGEPHETSHTDQVQRYIRMIRECGYKDVEGYLWYITPNDEEFENHIEPVTI